MNPLVPKPAYVYAPTVGCGIQQPHREGQETRVLGRPVSIITDDAERPCTVNTLFKHKWENKLYEWPSWGFSHKVKYHITEDLTTNKPGRSYLTTSESSEVTSISSFQLPLFKIFLHCAPGSQGANIHGRYDFLRLQPLNKTFHL